MRWNKKKLKRKMTWRAFPIRDHCSYWVVHDEKDIVRAEIRGTSIFWYRFWGETVWRAANITLDHMKFHIEQCLAIKDSGAEGWDLPEGVFYTPSPYIEGGAAAGDFSRGTFASATETPNKEGNAMNWVSFMNYHRQTWLLFDRDEGVLAEIKEPSVGFNLFFRINSAKNRAWLPTGVMIDALKQNIEKQIASDRLASCAGVADAADGNAGSTTVGARCGGGGGGGPALKTRHSTVATIEIPNDGAQYRVDVGGLVFAFKQGGKITVTKEEKL